MPGEETVLTSLHNPHVKYARSLHVRKIRHRERAFLVEGFRLFYDALAAGAVPRRVFIDQTKADDQFVATRAELSAKGIPFHPVTPPLLNAIADTQTPQGVIAVFDFPEIPVLFDGEAGLLVVADGLKDPGNVGTLMRAAAGAGAHLFLVSPETVDPYAPKVVRSAMGAHFRLPVRQFRWQDPPELLLHCAERYAAEAGGEMSYERVNWTRSAALIVGSEARGISDEARMYVTGSVSIPLKRGLESLNAAIAGAVILFEAARQRRTQ